MKNKIIISLICLLTSATVFAQDSTKATTKAVFSTRMMTVQFGYSYLTNNSILKQFYTPVSDELSQNYWTFGLASTSEYKRLITGITIQGGMTQPVTIKDYLVTGNNYQVSSNYGNLMLHLGYSIISTDKFKLYPILGIGGGRIALQIQSIDNFSISQIASSGGTESTIYKYMPFFDAGWGFDLLLKAPMATDERNFGGVLGIRAGYTQGVGVGNWRFNSGTITDNPSYNPGMFYVKANIGFYGKWNKDMMKNKMGCMK